MSTSIRVHVRYSSKGAFFRLLTERTDGPQLLVNKDRARFRMALEPAAAKPRPDGPHFPAEAAATCAHAACQQVVHSFFCKSRGMKNAS